MQEVIVETSTPVLPFLNTFNAIGDKVIGKFLGYVETDQLSHNKQRLFVVSVADVKYFLPSNFDLNRKLFALCQNAETVAINVELEYTSLTDLGGGKKIKNFKVLADEVVTPAIVAETVATTTINPKFKNK